MREQEGLISNIFRLYTAAKDTQGVIRALKKYGPEQPQLYVDVLTHFASSPKILEEAGDELDAQAAADRGHEKVVQILLENGANDAGDALLLASRAGNEEIVQILLENGADVNVQ